MENEWNKIVEVCVEWCNVIKLYSFERTFNDVHFFPVFFFPLDFFDLEAIFTEARLAVSS